VHIKNLAIWLLTLLCFLPQLVSAQDIDDSTSDRQTVSSDFEPSTLIVNVAGTNIEVFFYRPKDAGRFPLIILSHGCPRLEQDRIKIGPNMFKRQANAYAASGVAVAVPIRRGYGGHGQWVEGYGGCERADYYHAGLAGAEDINAVIATMSRLPEIDASRIVLMGVSAGGWASLATAATNPNVMGVVNFAGGRGSKASDFVCHEENLVSASQFYGRTSHAPELWIYSLNDHFFNQSLARRMFYAFNSAGGRATFISAPPYGEDGHKYINAISSWKPEVDEFLRNIGFLDKSI
jgi:dienelactone hydrolase